MSINTGSSCTAHRIKIVKLQYVFNRKNCKSITSLDSKRRVSFKVSKNALQPAPLLLTAYGIVHFSLSLLGW